MNKKNKLLLALYAALALVLIGSIVNNSAGHWFRICPSGDAVQMIRPFISASGFAYVISLPELNETANTNERPFQSDIVVCEDGRRIGPEHSMNIDIVHLGAGRYVHWRDVGITFSASDNSDPNINGRAYIAVRP